MKIKYQTVNNLKISSELLTFVNDELLDGTDISTEKFWSGFDKIVHELAPKNLDLIKIRENLQKKICHLQFFIILMVAQMMNLL